MRVLVTGGRNNDHRKVCAWLFANATELIGCGPHFVIDGGAHGADQGARLWCGISRHAGQTFHADWRVHGKSAGPIRNARMLAEGEPEIVIAFPGGSGTANMVGLARAAGVRVVEASGDFAKAAAP